MADTDDLFDGTDESTDGSTESGTEGKTSSAPQGDGGNDGTSDSQTESERVAHWMSKAQTAEAELNRLKGLDQKGKPRASAETKSGDAAAGEAQAPQPSEFEGYMRESVRRQLFAEEPRLKDFGFSLEDIAGDSLADMQANRTRLMKVIERASSKALNEAYERIGIDPSTAGGPTEKKDFNSMSEAEIEKEIERAKGLRPLGG